MFKQVLIIKTLFEEVVPIGWRWSNWCVAGWFATEICLSRNPAAGGTQFTLIKRTVSTRNAMQCNTHKEMIIGGKSQHIEQFNRGAPRNDVKWDPFAYAYRIYEVFNSTIIRKIIHDFLGYDKCRFFFLKKKSYDMCSLLRLWYILFL